MKDWDGQASHKELHGDINRLQVKSLWENSVLCSCARDSPTSRPNKGNAWKKSSSLCKEGDPMLLREWSESAPYADQYWSDDEQPTERIERAVFYKWSDPASSMRSLAALCRLAIVFAFCKGQKSCFPCSCLLGVDLALMFWAAPWGNSTGQQWQTVVHIVRSRPPNTTIMIAAFFVSLCVAHDCEYINTSSRWAKFRSHNRHWRGHVIVEHIIERTRTHHAMYLWRKKASQGCE